MVQETAWKNDTGSFRDPAGQVVCYANRTRRAVYNRDDLDELMRSGLYTELTERELLVRHSEISPQLIEPEVVPFISYPYEWPFSHLKSAALVTLDTALVALECSMMLKDASAFNVQWHDGHWKIIDTLSFTKYKEGEPWPAYMQFLQQFLYPLLFRKYRVPFNRYDLEGILQQQATKVLPRWLALNLKLAPNIYAPMGDGKKRTVKMSKLRLKGFLTYLRSVVNGLHYKPQKGWATYDAMSYLGDDRSVKRSIVTGMLSGVTSTGVVDLGANTGEYTNIARSLHLDTIAIDNEHDCANSIEPLSLWTDICNPSPALGWAGRERISLLDRLGGQDRAVLALALMHHLCIGRNVPVGMVFDVFTRIGKSLIVEFVPPDDPMAKVIGQGRVFPRYDRYTFVSGLEKRYRITGSMPIGDSGRVIFHATRHG